MSTVSTIKHTRKSFLEKYFTVQIKKHLFQKVFLFSKGLSAKKLEVLFPVCSEFRCENARASFFIFNYMVIYKEQCEFIYIYNSWHVSNEKAVSPELLNHFGQEKSIGKHLQIANCIRKWKLSKIYHNSTWSYVNICPENPHCKQRCKK